MTLPLSLYRRIYDLLATNSFALMGRTYWTTRNNVGRFLTLTSWFPLSSLQTASLLLFIAVYFAFSCSLLLLPVLYCLSFWTENTRIVQRYLRLETLLL